MIVPSKFKCFRQTIFAASATMLLAVGTTSQAFAQQQTAATTPASVQTKVYSSDEVDSKPAYPGGISQFHNFVNSKFNFPKKKEGVDTSIEITALVTISETGAVSDVKITKGISPDIDAQVAAIAKKSKNWKPAMLKEQPVACSLSVPVKLVKRTK